jgi:hypothetical protein
MNENGSPTLLDYLKFGGTTATGVLGALNQPKPAAQAPGKTNWALIGGIGAAVFAVLLLVVLVGKGK